MSTDPSTFDELAFKQMVRRAWGGDCCPHALRERVAAVRAGAAEISEPVLSIRPSGFQWQRWALAAAAAVVLAAGVPVLLHVVRMGKSSGGVPAVATVTADPAASDAASVVPVSLAEDLVSTHERCSRRADHHGLTVGDGDDGAIAAAMRSQLSRAVLVARPVDQQWHFRGAAICRVGTAPCGHLVFAKGDDAISVFSLPASAAPKLRDGDEISTVVQGHPIAGFAKDGAIFCLVASSPDTAVTAVDLRQMRDRMESAVTAPPTAAASNSDAQPVAVAELLQPLSH